MIISFAETTSALQARRKTVTRREWNPNHARKFSSNLRVQAWDKTPRVRGAKRVGTIEIERAPYVEMSDEIPEEDWEGEGFAYMQEHGLWLFGGMSPREVWDLWHDQPTPLYVVRFAVVGLTP